MMGARILLSVLQGAQRGVVRLKVSPRGIAIGSSLGCFLSFLN